IRTPSAAAGLVIMRERPAASARTPRMGGTSCGTKCLLGLQGCILVANPRAGPLVRVHKGLACGVSRERVSVVGPERIYGVTTGCGSAHAPPAARRFADEPRW